MTQVLTDVRTKKGDPSRRPAHPFLTNHQVTAHQLRKRHFVAMALHAFCVLAMGMTLLLLGILIFEIARIGGPWLSWDFLIQTPSRFAHKSGIKPALMGSLWLLSLTALWAIPLGIGAAIYLEELMPKSRWKYLIELNLANLTSVPSIVYGMLGLAIFVRFLGFGKSLLTGSLTLALLVLPVIMLSTREALRMIPSTLRQAALAVGATKWQTTRDLVLPQALPNILTGIILSLSRAIGETAPLIMVGAVSFIAFTPVTPMDEFTALPMQIFNWASKPQPVFQELAGAGILVLLVVLLGSNAFAIYLRYYLQRKNQCNRL